tara:strand:- start:574 stop:762 length:189 start_codon:yes stop_codon:yes gene_type:complete
LNYHKKIIMKHGMPDANKDGKITFADKLKLILENKKKKKKKKRGVNTARKSMSKGSMGKYNA